jgi:hypothetical protein
VGGEGQIRHVDLWDDPESCPEHVTAAIGEDPTRPNEAEKISGGLSRCPTHNAVRTYDAARDAEGIRRRQ